MKKAIVLVLAILLCFTVFYSCKYQDNASGSSDVNDIYKDVKPLDTPVELVIGQLNGSHHGVINNVIEKFGGFKKAGITITKWQVFGNGPIMVEASNEWDIGTYGIGGILAGAAKDIRTVAGAARDSGSNIFVAQKNSSVVTAGIKNVGGTSKLYGDASVWKGKEVAYPVGTTLQYVLGLALDKMGLAFTDISIVSMEVTSVNSALRAGQVEIGGLWDNFSYSADLYDKFVKVIDPVDVGCEIPTNLVASPRCYNDPNKEKAIAKWVELYFRTVDYMYGSKEAFSEIGDIWQAWNEQEGVKSTKAELLCQVSDPGNMHWTLKENYDLFHSTETISGKTVNGVEALSFGPLKFFHSIHNWDNITDEIFLNGLTVSKYVDEAYKAYKGNQQSNMSCDAPTWYKELFN